MFSTASSILRASTPSLARSVGYLHKGARVRGLIRDPSEVLINPKGQAYSLESVSSLKSFLSSEYALDDKVLLQVLTHKSFAHGSKPFNEKLAVYGSHFLKYKSAIQSIQSSGLQGLGSAEAKSIISKSTLSQYIKNNKLDSNVYWKKRDALITDSAKSGEDQVLSTVLEALVGALLLTKGKSVAEKFVSEKLLSENEQGSLINIARSA